MTGEVLTDRFVSTRPTFSFEVVARVETLKLDGLTQFVLQGRFGLVGSEGEPQMFAMAVPEETWLSTDLGRVLLFPLEST